MSVRRKTLLAIGLTSVGLLMLLFALAQFIVLRGFDRLQQEAVQENVLRVRNVIKSEQDSLLSFAGDWAYWDDTYQFVQDQNADYAESNLNYDSISNLKVDFILYTDLDDQLVFGKWVDYKAARFAGLPLDLDPKNGVLGSVLNLPEDLSINTGIILTDEGPALVAARKILTSQKSGPAQGKVVFGRLLSDNKINAFAEQTQLTVQIRSLKATDLTPDYSAARASLTAPNAPDSLYVLHDDKAEGYTLLSDITGAAALILEIAMPDSIYQQGQQTILYFVAGLLIAGLTFATVMVWLLEKIVLSRLAYLNNRVRDIAAHNKLSERIQMDGSDELSSLAGTINTSLAVMERSRAELQRLNSELEEKIADLNTIQSFRDQFFTNAAHEFRTPMAVLRTQLYLAERQPSLWQKHLEVLNNATNQLSGILNDVFDMAHFKRQNGNLYRQEVDFKTVVSKTIIASRPHTHQRGVQLTSEMLEADVLMRGDRSALEQAVANLIDFVVDNCEHGSAIQLNLSTTEQDSQVVAVLEVCSTGLQIEGAELSQIFLPFSKPSQGDVRNSGLQLSIAKEITELHKGDISAEIDSQKGICFRMRLPVERITPEQPAG